MKTLLCILSLTILTNANTEESRHINLEELQELYDNPSNEVTIINFWASWCGPCVREMPDLDDIAISENVDLYFISLDFKQDYMKADKLLAKKGIKSTNFFIDEKDPDKMIRGIEESWSGAIPATLFVHKSGRRIFHEEELSKKEIQTIIKNLSTN
ncbi:MAG: thiol-disulfide isomerase/thioredoxin [Cyclobacteriaceae bacterium]|jgi:thiol-disulfide isomerase/thioredoxin